MTRPHGWVEDYQYDSVSQLLKVTDTDPSNNDMKQQKHAYTYDDCGNMTYEYMRGNGTGEATVENTYTYDALHRVISAHENYGNKTRTYQYDSLGNLTYETELGNKSIDYKFNNLNQITQKSEDGWNTQSTFPEAHGEITYTNVYNITELLKFWVPYDTAYQTVRDYYNKLTCEQKNYFKDSFGIEFK